MLASFNARQTRSGVSGRSLIRTPVEGYFRWEAEAVEAVLRSSELKPYLVQKLCINAVSRMLEAGRSAITLGDVAAARDEVRLDADEPDAVLPGRLSA